MQYEAGKTYEEPEASLCSIEDDASEEFIEECAKDVAFQYIDWYWEKVDDSGQC